MTLPGEPVQAALPLAHGLRIEGGVAVPRHPQLNLADLGRHRLRVGPVAVVARPSAGRRRDVRSRDDRSSRPPARPAAPGAPARSTGRCSPVSSTPSARARSTSSAAQSRIAGSSPTNGTLRTGTRSPCSQYCSHRSDPLQPTALSRGPSDHPGYTDLLTLPGDRGGVRDRASRWARRSGRDPRRGSPGSPVAHSECRIRASRHLCRPDMRSCAQVSAS